MTTGVNKAPSPKTFTYGGLCGALGNLLKVSLLRIYRTIWEKHKWMLCYCTTGAASGADDCNLCFTSTRGFIWSWRPRPQNAAYHAHRFTFGLRSSERVRVHFLIWSHFDKRIFCYCVASANLFIYSGFFFLSIFMLSIKGLFRWTCVVNKKLKQQMLHHQMRHKIYCWC